MSEVVLHPKPRWEEIAREQFRAVGIAQRRELALLAIGTLLLVLLFVYAIVRHGPPEMDRSNFPQILSLLVTPASLLGLFWPLSVWKDEGPTRRSYLGSMPVDRPLHTVMKSLNGWLWLMIVGLCFLAVVLLLFTVTGNARSIDAPAYLWVRPFTAATTMYLLGSVAAILADHPGRWIIGVAIGYGVLMGVLSITELHEVRETLQGIVSGRLGLGTALTGTVEVPQARTLPNGRQIVAVIERRDFGAWVAALLLWLGLGSAGTVFAATRHLER